VHLTQLGSAWVEDNVRLNIALASRRGRRGSDKGLAVALQESAPQYAGRAAERNAERLRSSPCVGGESQLAKQEEDGVLLILGMRHEANAADASA